MSPLDENVPELSETFELILVSAVSNDGQSGSTPTSGASIRPSFDRCSIVVPENDNPNGVLQLMPNLPSQTGYFRPLAMPINITVAEEIETIVLYAVRAQGTWGKNLFRSIYLT